MRSSRVPPSPSAALHEARIRQRTRGNVVEDVRVLIVSMGALEKGPIAPEMRPMIMYWYDGSTCRSGCCWSANFFSSWYVVKFAPARA